MKKLAAVFLAVLLMLSFAPACFAQTDPLEFPDAGGMQVTVPDGLYAFTKETEPGDENLKKVGITDWFTALAGYKKIYESDQSKTGRKSELLFVALSEGGGTTIAVTKLQSSQTQEYFDMATMEEAKLEEMIKSYEEPVQGADIKSSAERYDNAERPYVRLDVNGTVEEEKIWERSYVTIVNGFSVTVDLYSHEEVTDEQGRWLQSMVDGIRFTDVKAAPEPQDTAAGIQALLVLLLPLGILVAIVAVPFIVSTVSRKKDRRRRALLSEKLGGYRKQQLEAERVAQEAGISLKEPETLFQNTTDCNTERVKKNCTFTCFRKQLGAFLFSLSGGILCVAVAVFMGDGNAFLRILLAAAGLFFVIRPFMLPSKVFRSEERVYSKGRSRKAVYHFRAEDFRVSGIQAASVYPYFQITSAYETKDMFYLYFGAQRAYLVSKDGFEKGDAQGLSQLLRQQLGSEFHSHSASSKP